MARGKSPAVRQARQGKSASSQVDFCPLCIEPLDDTERAFFPCPCGYQVCLFCFDRLKLECGSLCPGCRTEYGSEKNPFSKPTVKQRAAAAARPSPTRLEQTQPSSSQNLDNNIALQASPSAKPRPLTPNIEQTAFGLRPGSAKPPVSTPQDPVVSAPPTAPAAAVPSSSTQAPAQQHQVEQSQPWSLPLLASQAGSGRTAIPAAASAAPQQPVTQHESRSSQPHPQAQPSLPHMAPQASAALPQQHPQQANGTLHKAQGDDAVQWVFHHLGLEAMAPVAPDPKGQMLLQSVRSSLAAGQMSFKEGADELITFIQRRGQASSTTPAPTSPPISQPQPTGVHTSSPAPIGSTGQQLYSHLPQAATGNGPSIWATGTGTAWPSSTASSHSIWADAASPYTSAPYASNAGQGVSRLHSLWGHTAPTTSTGQSAVTHGGVQGWGQSGGEQSLANGYQPSSMFAQLRSGTVHGQNPSEDFHLQASGTNWYDRNQT